jgi:site-specific DNA-methyltransferase (adenine-specific)
VWDKGNGRPYRGGFSMQTEYVIWGGVGKLPRQDVYIPGVLRHPSKTNGKRHITEKPVGLMRDLVRFARPGGLVLDPFAGSSSTGEAALLEGYRYHGMESAPGYFDISRERLEGLSHE